MSPRGFYAEKKNFKSINCISLFFFNMEELYIKKGQMNPSAQEETQPERPNNDNNY